MSKPQNKAEALAHMEVQEARRWYQLGSGTWKSIRGYYKRDAGISWVLERGKA
jgi:hypothetical protein